MKEHQKSTLVALGAIAVTGIPNLTMLALAVTTLIAGRYLRDAWEYWKQDK